MKLTCKNNLFFKETENQLYLRGGIWTTMEIIFERSELENEGVNFDVFKSQFIKLLHGDVVDMDFSNKYEESMFSTLVTMGVLEEFKGTGVTAITYVVSKKHSNKIENFSSSFRYNVVTIESIQEIVPNSYLNETNYLANEKIESEFCKLQLEENVIIISDEYNVLFLRKMNRLLMKFEKNWVLGQVDGSFLLFAAFDTNYTGCFECLEQNEMVRLLDLHNYNKQLLDFEMGQVTKNNGNQGLVNYIISTLNLMTENSTIEKQSQHPLTGKVYSVYHQTFESNVENLLRMPTCPTCGYRALEKTSDYSVDSKRIISELLTQEVD